MESEGVSFISDFNLDEFNNELDEIFYQIEEDARKDFGKIIKGFAQQIVDELKATSNRSGRLDRNQAKIYAEGWTYKTDTSLGQPVYIIYNKNKPHLTHLLEYGWENDGTVVAGNHNMMKTFEKYKEKIVEELHNKLLNDL